MTDREPISEQQLNAFIDGQLDHEERARILDAMEDNKALSADLAQLQRINELIRVAYTDLEKPTRLRLGTDQRSAFIAFAASLALIIGLTLGWILRPVNTPTAPAITSLAQLNLKDPGNDKILIHINAMQHATIDRALSEAQTLLEHANQKNKPVQVEILANASGLGLLREHSPYADRISRLADHYPTVSFRACGFAMEHARLKEGRDVKLLPQAEPVDAALEEIVRRLKQGWLYVRS